MNLSADDLRRGLESASADVVPSEGLVDRALQGGRRRRQRRRLAVTSGALLGVAGIALAAVAVGTPGRSASELQPAVGLESALSSIQEVGRLRLTVLGSVAQRRAGEVVTFHAVQDPIGECMTGRGVAYTPPLLQDMYAGVTDQVLAAGEGWLSATSTTGFGLASRAAARSRGPAPAADNSYEGLSEADKARYSTALSSCVQARPSSLSAFPVDALELDADLTALLSKVLTNRAVAREQGKYPECMADGGFPVEDPTSLVESLALPDTAQGAPAWQEAAQRADAAAKVDSTCRAALLANADRLLASQLPDWQRQNAARLTSVQNGWQALQTEATKYR